MRQECTYFSELSVDQLYDILQLREEVFEIEQECIYPDIDDKDRRAHHCMIYENNQLVAYARILDKGISYSEYSSIGRVCTHSSVRNKGYGKIIMMEAIRQCESLYPDTKIIKISAQSYLIRFYSELGFSPKGEEYMEDNIPHTAMILILA